MPTVELILWLIFSICALIVVLQIVGIIPELDIPDMPGLSASPAVVLPALTIGTGTAAALMSLTEVGLAQAIWLGIVGFGLTLILMLPILRYLIKSGVAAEEVDRTGAQVIIIETVSAGQTGRAQLVGSSAVFGVVGDPECPELNPGDTANLTHQHPDHPHLWFVTAFGETIAD